MSKKLGIPSRLPEELLAKCIEYLHTERWTLLDLCKTSKRFRRLTIPVLYSNVELDGAWRMRNFLLRIMRDQSLALFVKALTLRWEDLDPEVLWRTGYDFYKLDDRTVDKQRLAELGELRAAALEHNLGLNYADVLEKNINSTIAIILLCSVPNLVKLHIKSKFQSESHRFFKSETPFGTRFLRKLEHYIDQQKDNLAIILRFFQLPSIRVMELHHWTEFPRDLGRYRGTSPIESICLENCSIGQDSLLNLMAVPRNLKHFSVDCGHIDHGWNNARDSSLFGEGLDHFWDSLETLSLVYVYPVMPAVRSFQKFKALTRLRITFQLLPGFKSKETFHLVDSLPPNLKQLELLPVHPETTGPVLYPHRRKQLLNDSIESVREFLQERENQNSPGKLTRIRFPRGDIQCEPLKSLINLGVCAGVIVSN